MKAITLCLSACLLLSSCSSLFKRQPTAVQHTHYIMTLHGVRGNTESFGDFHSLIKTHLESVDPSYKVVPINMTYKTGQTDFSPHKAAQEINDKLEALIPSLDPQDKISILAYSMGGQVGSIWYFDSLKSEKYKKYPLQTVKFLSLGSPFWGSKEASLAISTENIFGQLESSIPPQIIATIKDYMIDFANNYDKNILPYSKISFAELQALAAGSDVTNEIRLNKISYPNATKWISLSSLVNCMETNLDSAIPGCQSFQNDLFRHLNVDVFGKYTFGYIRRETDNSVITPSANDQFIYAVDSDSNYADGKSTGFDQFHYLGDGNNHKFYLAEGLHATVIPASLYEKALNVLGKAGDSWKGLADDVVLVYEKDCKTPETCKHPAYKYILNEFADCENANSNCLADVKTKNIDAYFNNKLNHDDTEQKALKSELHGFTMELNLRVPKGYDLTKITHKNIFNFIKTNFEDSATHALKSAGNWPYTIYLARPNELASLIIKKVTHYTNQDELRVIMTGLIIPKDDAHYDYVELENGAYLNFSIALPNLKSRKIQALVRPYYSTYVDFVMAP